MDKQAWGTRVLRALSRATTMAYSVAKAAPAQGLPQRQLQWLSCAHQSVRTTRGTGETPALPARALTAHGYTGSIN